jgi:uncharacterized protein YdiU (UPF0061 family)
LLPLICENEAAEAIDYYRACYEKNWLRGMRDKLGLSGEEPGDTELIAEFLELMATNKSDFTATFRALCNDAPTLPPEFSVWKQKWLAKLSCRLHDISSEMKKYNPAVIPRNHRVEEALSAAEEGNYTVMHELLDALSKPFEDSEVYSLPPESISCEYKTFCGT